MQFENATLSAMAEAVRANMEAYRQQDAIDEAHRPVAEKWDELDEFGHADQDGATLSASDWENARAGM